MDYQANQDSQNRNSQNPYDFKGVEVSPYTIISPSELTNLIILNIGQATSFILQQP